jgi:hypothetical protein
MVRPSNLARLVQGNVTSARDVLNVVHGRDCGISIGFLTISDEPKATAAASVSVFDDDLDGRWLGYCVMVAWQWDYAYCFLDSSKLLEFLAKSVLIGVPCEASEDELAIA